MDGAFASMIKDPELQSFINRETQKQKIQSVIHDINEKCWDVCMDKPASRLDNRTESCLKNCVDRFIDANIVVTNKLEAKAEAESRSSDSDY